VIIVGTEQVAVVHMQVAAPPFSVVPP